MHQIKNNIILKIVILILISLVLSFLIEIFLNINVLMLSNNNKGTINLNDYSIKIEDGKTVVDIDLENKYINKLVLNYDSEKDIDIVIKYKSNDKYGNKKIQSVTDKLDNEVNQQVTNINNNVYHITYEINSTNEVNISKISINNSFIINYLRLIFVFDVLLLISFIYFFIRKKLFYDKLHISFVIIGILLGGLFIILEPSTTYYSWDDQIHFQNMLHLKGGNIKYNIGEFSMIDSSPVGRGSINSIEELENQNKYLSSGKFSKFSVSAPHFITYNKVAYIPFSLAYYFLKFLGLPFIICFKFSKFFNLLLYLFVIAFSIKKAKVGKKTIFVIGLLPSTLFLATQFSYDPCVIAGITLSSVYLINWLSDKDSKIVFKDLLIYLIALCCACFTKAIYIPLLLLFLLIPNDRFDSKKQAKIVKVIMLMIFIFILSTFILPSNFSSSNGGDLRGGFVNTGEQLKLILTHPFGYLDVVKNTVLPQMFTKLIGIEALNNYAYLGRSSNNIYYLTLLLLLFVGIFDNKNNNLENKNKILAIIALLLIVILIWTALYLSFTPVGLNKINGVQARYFIPLLFLLLISLQNHKISINISEHQFNIIIVICTILINITSIYKLLLLPFCL